MTKHLNKIDIKALEEEYKPLFDIFTQEENKTYRLKRIIAEELDETERRIILLYAELQSQRKVAKLLGISTSLVNIKVGEIRRKIIEKFNAR